ncbi:MAG: ABC transporter substrate-binding protein [Actinomycetota bacterium]
MLRRSRMLFLLLALVLVAAGCAGGEPGGGGGDTTEEEDGGGGEISIAASWVGGEQESFEAVLDAFTEESGIDTRYQGSDDLPTFLGTQLEGGDPPDVAMIPQPGLLAEFASGGSVVELGDEATQNLEENYGQYWIDLATVDGTLYGVYFKAASKGTWWYNTQAMEQAGVQPPASWDEMLQTAGTVNSSGTPWLSIGGADAWPLTDIFENVYLQVAGPDKYDQLAEHKIPWTDPSVIESLTTLGELLGEDANLAGGQQGALQTAFVDSVTQVYTTPPEAATVYEGDFVGGVIGAETNAKVGQDADFFTFPEISGGEGAGGIVGAGDVGVALTDNPDAQELLAYLATPEAAEEWASLGGFTSPNLNLSLDVYPDEISRRIAEGVVKASEAESFRFDLSDLQPPEFGATAGRGMWLRMQDFLKNPDDVQGVAQALESDAKKAFK